MQPEGKTGHAKNQTRARDGYTLAAMSAACTVVRRARSSSAHSRLLKRWLACTQCCSGAPGSGGSACGQPAAASSRPRPARETSHDHWRTLCPQGGCRACLRCDASHARHSPPSSGSVPLPNSSISTNVFSQTLSRVVIIFLSLALYVLNSCSIL